MRHWLTLGIPPPGKDANELKQLRFVRALNIRSLIFVPILAALFFLWDIPPWGFIALGAAVLIEAVSIYSLTVRIRNAQGT